MTALLVLPVIILLLSVMLPLHLKFGGEKGRIASIAAIWLLVILGVVVVKTAC